MIEVVRIPEDRKRLLMAGEGKITKIIEESTGTKIECSDIVKISGEDSLRVLKAKEIVTAMGRGFTLKEARRLLEKECELRIISLEGENLKTRKRLLGRVIGRQGKSKKWIEAKTGALICVKGKTLSIIGTPEELGPAEEAVEQLLNGKTHAYAYKKMNIKKAKT